MGIKQEIKKEMPISSLNIHATDVVIAISSFHEGLKDWRCRFEVAQKALKSRGIKKGAPLSPNLC